MSARTTTPYNEPIAHRGPVAGTGAVGMSRVSWGAIIVGAVIAISVMLMLAMLGLGIGASTIGMVWIASSTNGALISTGASMIFPGRFGRPCANAV